MFKELFTERVINGTPGMEDLEDFEMICQHIFVNEFKLNDKEAWEEAVNVGKTINRNILWKAIIAIDKGDESKAEKIAREYGNKRLK